MKHRYFILILVVVFYFFILDVAFNGNTSEDTLNENISINSYFCRDINCEKLFLELFNKSTERIYCAFFDFDLIEMKNVLESKFNYGQNILVLVDNDNNIFNDSEFILFDKRSAYMHNKFCIIDNDILVTGSFNPTINGRDKNDNNIILLRDKTIVNLYEKYFISLINESLNDNYKHSNKNRNHRVDDVEICFSRGGNCLNKIKEVLLSANESIKFMTFSFTDDDIGRLLLYKKYLSDVMIEGIFEKTSINKYSEYSLLKFHLSNISIIKDCNKGKMHHKVFIVDKKIVITGSFNPSNNADKNNDENMLIINNKKIAENYINEFERVKLLCMM